MAINLIVGGCMKDGGDLAWDPSINHYVCSKPGCAALQSRVARDPGDLVVEKGRAPSTLITISQVAREIGITQSGAEHRASRLSITSTKLGGYRAVTADEAQRIKDYRPGAYARRRATPKANPYALTVELASGGTVLLAVNVRFLALSPADRAFVFDLVDRITAYGSEG